MMLYETIGAALEKTSESPRLHRALCALRIYKLETLRKGRNEVCGDEIYINCMEYETAKAERKVWEAHQVYYDVHCVLEGEERVQLSPRSAMTEKDAYKKEGDYQLFDGLPTEEVFLRKGMVLICTPDDVHKVGVAFGAPRTVKKMVMKVRLG